jgi:hypothetical protein
MCARTFTLLLSPTTTPTQMSFSSLPKANLSRFSAFWTCHNHREIDPKMSLKHNNTSWMADSFVEVGENHRQYRQKWISDYNFFKAVESYKYGVDGNEEQKKLDKFNWTNFTREIH